MNWYLAVLKKYADFGGRARRKEYWMFTLFNCIILVAVQVIFSMLGSTMASVGMIIAIIYDLAVLLPALGVAIRRMHDTGHSGWWILVPIVNLVFACTATQPGDNEYGPQPTLD